jgi:diaminopimelate decarboxylase
MHRDGTLTSSGHAPHAFEVQGNELMIGGLSVSMLAQQVGRTPFYAYDRRKIDDRVAELRRVLPASVKLHYAIKANPMPAVVQHLAQRVDGLDVASGGELRLALDTGIDRREISFAGPGKSITELQQAAAAGILINVESAREVRELVRVAANTTHTARIAVRVNPDFELKSSGMKMGGGPKPFGVDAEQVPALLREIGQSGLRFEGFHIFSGSQNLRSAAICEAQTKALELAIRLAEHAPAPVKVVNIGGGFGIPYFPGEHPLELATVGDNLGQLAQRQSSELPEAELVVELGRFLVGEAGVYVCRVVDRKISRGQVFLVTDGGLHHHLAASGNFGQVVRKNYPVAIGNRMAASATEAASVVGPLCTPLDLLAEKMVLPSAAEGDLVVVFQSGAYGYSASPHGFLSHPAPLEVLV